VGVLDAHGAEAGASEGRDFGNWLGAFHHRVTETQRKPKQKAITNWKSFSLKKNFSVSL